MELSLHMHPTQFSIARTCIYLTLGCTWHSSSPELSPFLVLVSFKPSGDSTPAATLHSEHRLSSWICFPAVITQFHILVSFSMGVGIKKDISTLLQSPHNPDHILHCDTHACISTTPLYVPCCKDLQSCLFVCLGVFVCLFFHLGIPGFSHPFAIADAWELFNY